MTETEADITEVFWVFVHQLCTMTYDSIRTTAEFDTFNTLVTKQSAFKMHTRALDDLDMSVIQGTPSGTWVHKDYMYFADVNSLFTGIYELYTTQQPSCKRTSIMQAMKTLHEFVNLKDTIDMLEAL